jgi:hypothetical protein
LEIRPSVRLSCVLPCPEVVRLLRCLHGEISREKLQKARGLSDAEYFRKSYINPALTLNAKRREVQESLIRASKAWFRSVRTGAQRILAGWMKKKEKIRKGS